jgi:transposase-like protein
MSHDAIRIEEFDQGTKQEFYERLAEGVKKVVRTVIETSLQEELTHFVGANRHERTPGRCGHRNGSYGRDLETMWGVIENLKVPRGRQKHERDLLQRYQRRQPQVEKVIGEMFVRGISTANVQEVTDLLWDKRSSPSTVSRIFHSLQQDYLGWKNRPLEKEYLYLYLDGTYSSAL